MAVKSQRPRTKTEDTRTALVWASERWIPVTMLQGVNDCRHVAGIVRQQLSDMGFQVADRRVPVVVESTDIDDDDEDEDDLTDDVQDEASESPGEDRVT
jgi:hypothetical protein